MRAMPTASQWSLLETDISDTKHRVEFRYLLKLDQSDEWQSMSGKALAAGSVHDLPAASALPLTINNQCLLSVEQRLPSSGIHFSITLTK